MMVKVVLKDLPLHAVSNSEVLEALHEVLEVESEVSYCNVWYKGRLTNIQNGDRFVYIKASELSKVADTLQVGNYHARVFKPKHLTIYKCYGQEGHHTSDKSCPAHTPCKVEDTIDAFCSGKYPLSNLHKCLHGCVAKEGEKIFPSSEHCFQFKKLKVHNKTEEAFELLDEPDPFKVMQKSKEILSEDAVMEDWKYSACDKMRDMIHLKFQTCEHAKQALLDSGLMIVEATGDKFWGSGLTLDQTKQCLLEYWLGENYMGKILMDLQHKYTAERETLENALGVEGKQKATSPLTGPMK